MEVSPLTQKFVDALNQKFAGKETIFGAIKFDALLEEKYDKVTLPRWDGSSHGSAHAFVERETGKLFKAASWKYPVQESKYDLTGEENFTRVVELADPFGIYLDTGNRYKSYADPTYGISDKSEVLNKNYKCLPQ